MTIRDKRQKEFAEMWIEGGKRGVLYLCPRFGKIYTTINALEKLPMHSTILIAYPDVKIKNFWEVDFKKRGYNNPNITYTTHLSLKKYVNFEFDVIIIDEIHLLSDNQIEAAKELLKDNKYVLGLTGTLSSYTEKNISLQLGLNVIAEYSIEKAIEEGIIVDYEINIIKVPLDNVIYNNYNGKRKTEKQRFDNLSWVIDDKEAQGYNTMFLRLSRMRIIQKSIAKLNKTKELLKKYKDDRILVFCGITEIADNIGIPAYHSKIKEKEIFNDFVIGKGKHLAVVKIGNSGVTYTPLNRVIINYFDSNAQNLAQRINRCMGMEYNNPDKKAKIDIICTTEHVEQRWLTKALEFFDKDKIKYI